MSEIGNFLDRLEIFTTRIFEPSRLVRAINQQPPHRLARYDTDANTRDQRLMQDTHVWFINGEGSSSVLAPTSAALSFDFLMLYFFPRVCDGRDSNILESIRQ